MVLCNDDRLNVLYLYWKRNNVTEVSYCFILFLNFKENHFKQAATKLNTESIK